MGTGIDVVDRKRREAEFHDRREVLRRTDRSEYERITRNFKFYSINRRSKAFVEGWLREQCTDGTIALDYCCGPGPNSEFIADCGARVVGIDISSASIQAGHARLKARQSGGRAWFVVGDAESTCFRDRQFDVVLCNGVLHHVDLTKALSELTRIVKPTGRVVCVEALAHNPVFQLYRRLTPHLRTEWEVDHILSRREIGLASRYFESVSIHFFHLTELLAVPLRHHEALFKPALRFLGKLDRFLLSIPGLRWWAWQCVFILARPRSAG